MSDHDGGLAKDMPLLTRRRMVAGLGLVGAVGVGGVEVAMTVDAGGYKGTVTVGIVV